MSQCSGKSVAPRSLRRVVGEAVLFGIGFSIGSLLFNVTLQGVLYGIFRVLGFGR